MKQYILILALTAVVVSSCTTAYKTGQTPDDVYYSPVRPQDEYVRTEKQEDNSYRGSEDYYEDRFLRMRLQDRYRWSALDDYYFYNTYAYNAYGNYHSWNSPWNSYWAWNNYYNPYCGGIPYYYPGTIIIKNPKTYTPPSKALVFNPSSYNTGNVISSAASKGGMSKNYNNSRYSNTNRNTNSSNSLGESLKKVFSGNNSDNYNSGSNNSSTPSRSYTPSSSSSSSGGSSGKSGGGVSRPPR